MLCTSSPQILKHILMTILIVAFSHFFLNDTIEPVTVHVLSDIIYFDLTRWHT